MAYTDLTSSFIYKSLLNHQKGEQLLANDNHLVDMLGSYKRPNLVFIDTDTIDVENNVPSDPNSTKIIFHDGDVRTVQEDTSVSHQYRRLKRLSSPSLTVPHDSGSSGISDWRAIYAVKTTDDSTKFVLVSTNLMPVVSNYATLNSTYGTDGWVYLGLSRTDDGLGSAGFLDFKQIGAKTLFRNTISGGVIPLKRTGVLIKFAIATSTTYIYFTGISGSALPSHLKVVCYGVSSVDGNLPLITDENGQSVYSDFEAVTTDVDGFTDCYWIDARKGLRITNPASETLSIFICGFIDHVLSIGPNPEL